MISGMVYIMKLKQRSRKIVVYICIFLIVIRLNGKLDYDTKKVIF